MTRGKYAARAANRRAEIEAEAGIAAYQKRVAELTAEVKRAAEEREKSEAALRATIRLVAAERDEGTGPMLRTVEAENRRLRERVDLAEREVKKVRQTWTRALGRLQDHMMVEHGATALEATEHMAWFCDPTGDGAVLTLVDQAELRQVRSSGIKRVGQKGDAVYGDAVDSEIERVRTLQRARGERK